jgi:hypothetical protein
MIVGIDLGTTNSLVGIWPWPDHFPNNIIISVVYGDIYRPMFPRNSDWEAYGKRRKNVGERWRMPARQSP